jgi:hypothetical protein
MLLERRVFTAHRGRNDLAAVLEQGIHHLLDMLGSLLRKGICVLPPPRNQLS